MSARRAKAVRVKRQLAEVTRRVVIAASPAQITGQRQKKSRERSDLIRAALASFRHHLLLACGR